MTDTCEECHKPHLRVSGNHGEVTCTSCGHEGYAVEGVEPAANEPTIEGRRYE